MVIRLDGDGWQLRGCLGDEWTWHVGPDKDWDAPGWLPARVPGSVVDDLWHAGEVADPYRERNSLLVEWVAARAWVYRRRIGEGTVRFEGVDHAATVFLDGEEVAHHEGAFAPFEVEAGPGEHLLAVVVHPAPASEPQVGRTSRVRVHKSRMGYGWDFCPRLVHQGIWRSVTQRDRATEPPGRPRALLVDGVGIVEVDGEVVLEVRSPRLWWPNGMGEQALYDVDGTWVGFRTVELLDDYALLVNGQRTPIRGWNWVPLDVLYGVPRPDKLAHLLRLAARSHANLVRVWGGGLLETEEFYELCDQLGLMVWQEFSLSSSGLESRPSDDPDFVRTLATDARAIVGERAHHPSLVLWCGGNELDADGSEPALEALRSAVAELDPERAWLTTSPSRDGCDEHGPWEHQGLGQHYRHYDSRTSALHSEFGVEGMTNRRSLEALIPAARRWPADRTNPVYEHLGAWWNNAPLVQAAFGNRLHDVRLLRRASQWLQYDGLRYAVEAGIRRGAGTIPWQLNESYPNAWCTSALDHRGDPKPAYYGVARAYRPGHASAELATSAWGGHEIVRARVSDDSPARIVDADGTVVAESRDGELSLSLAEISTDVFVLDVERGSRYVLTRTETLEPLLDLEPATLEVRRAGSRVELRHVSGPCAVGVVLEDARPYEAAGWVTFDDNVLDLLPGEARELATDGAGELLVSGWNVEEFRV